MNKYVVRKMQHVSPIEMTIRWGIFDSRPSELGVHFDDPDANVLIWTYSELVAEKICELLNLDEYSYEYVNAGGWTEAEKEWGRPSQITEDEREQVRQFMSDKKNK